MKRDMTNWTMEITNCLQCKVVFSAPVWAKRKTCSVKCSNNLPSKTRMKGKKVSSATKEKMRLSAIGKKHPWASLKGELNPNWIKDRTKLAKRQERNDMAYKDWRRLVKNRDGWKCKISNSDCSGSVVAHHILGWAAYPELRYEVNNGITLCHFHHPRKRVDETNLSPYFQELVKNIK